MGKESEEKIIQPDEGSGWEVVEVDGREYARRSANWQGKLGSKLIRSAKIPGRYIEKELATFQTSGAVLTAAVSMVKDFIRAYPAVDRGLLLVGPPGTGKTHLATAALKSAIEKCRVQGLFVDYRELIRGIQDSFNPKVETTSQSLIQPVLKAELLVMDELGALNPTEWVLDTITYIINNRYTEDKLTIFTTNFPIEGKNLERDRLGHESAFQKDLKKLQETHLQPEEYKAAHRRLLSRYSSAGERFYTLQDKIGERLMSRLYEMCQIIPFDGVPDYRRR